MTGIHPVHRRLADLALRAQKLGSYKLLSPIEQQDLMHCMTVNLNIIAKLDELKSLSFVAHVAGDMGWQQDICKEIEDLEAQFS